MLRLPAVFILQIALNHTQNATWLLMWGANGIKFRADTLGKTVRGKSVGGSGIPRRIHWYREQ
ncbi:Uncharacterised protein [Klebsiella pneumoniae]|nr:Uncharacterised protein [Klebsiella pneumoniae]